MKNEKQLVNDFLYTNTFACITLTLQLIFFWLFCLFFQLTNFSVSEVDSKNQSRELFYSCHTYSIQVRVQYIPASQFCMQICYYGTIKESKC